VKRAPDNVRYLEQFGRHILTRSFTACDPIPTSASLTVDRGSMGHDAACEGSVN